MGGRKDRPLFYKCWCDMKNIRLKNHDYSRKGA
jgi:hypothetical protein